MTSGSCVPVAITIFLATAVEPFIPNETSKNSYVSNRPDACPSYMNMVNKLQEQVIVAT